MQTLERGVRVRVLRCGRTGDETFLLPEGATGVPTRKLFRDGSWWVSLDKRYEGVHFPFPEDDKNRSTNVIVWPQDCQDLEKP